MSVVFLLSFTLSFILGRHFFSTFINLLELLVAVFRLFGIHFITFKRVYKFFMHPQTDVISDERWICMYVVCLVWLLAVLAKEQRTQQYTYTHSARQMFKSHKTLLKYILCRCAFGAYMCFFFSCSFRHSFIGNVVHFCYC